MSRILAPGVCDGAAPAAEARAAGAAADWRTVLGVFKLRIGTLIMITALAGLAVVPGGTATALQALVLALSVLVASASAGAFNQFAEHDLDARMARTARRAFVTGAATPDNRWLALIAALLLVSVALGGWAFNLTVAFHLFMGAFFYGVVYTVILKRRTWMNIVVGGLAVFWRGWATHAPIGYGADLPALLSTELFASSAIVVGCVVARRRPRSVVAWLLVTLGLAAAAVTLGLYAGAVRAGSSPHPGLDLDGWLAGGAMQPAMGSLTGLLMFLFPDGRLPSRRWRAGVAVRPTRTASK